MPAFDPLRTLVRSALSNQKARTPTDAETLRFAVLDMLTHDTGFGLMHYRRDNNGLPSAIKNILFDLFAIEFLFVPADDRIERGLRWQYPGICHVCTREVCTCSLVRMRGRPEPRGNTLLPATMTPKTIRDWQVFFARLYPNEGMEKIEIVTRLASEAHEACATALDQALLRHKNETAVELAQVFAWVCAFATHLEFSLEACDSRATMASFLNWLKRLQTTSVS
ncbi:TPA: hypothetical protein DDZ10_02875 [Candidatus Uhrbacteria bacterium]|uniref:Uncharacterized protein n=1 Tax=Candidatus Uhrbacteria bacterium GW2011_GWC2_53_7 TaxID=1618986 RepID=A0A0G1Y1C8_9BACT|nr:MAG: hypothetical protein UY82_C0006G0005 [Candidatus Uhrbacteria bacterium GW2011_GWC2_53_7]HBL39591.1 hypothetical protein [Candidatus Uhrbacteria bacterium]